MTSSPLWILAWLCTFVVVSEWLVRSTAMRHAGTALIVILVTAVAANIGVLPAGSTAEAPVPVYDGIFTYVAPLAIFWILLRVRLRDIVNAGLPIIALFLIGAAGTMLGAIIAMRIVGGETAIGPLYHAVGGMYVGTYIGGGINFNALALHYDVVRDGVLFAGAVAVDNVVTTAWMVATLALPRLLAPLWRRRSEAAAPRAQLITGIEDDTETLHPIDFGVVLALGFASVYVSEVATAALAGVGITIPSILFVTAVALVLAQFPAVARLRGTRLVGMFAVYLFLAVVGAYCDIFKLTELGRLGLVLLAFATILVVVHGTMTYGAARLLRLDLDVASVASQANIGGSTTALAVARSLGRGDLVLPAILIGSLGNAIGTFLGFWIAEAMR